MGNILGRDYIQVQYWHTYILFMSEHYTCHICYICHIWHIWNWWHLAFNIYIYICQYGCQNKCKDLRNAANHLRYPKELFLGPTIETGNTDSDRKYLWYITILRFYALNINCRTHTLLLNITVFYQMYYLHLVIRDNYTFKGSFNVKVMAKCIFFSQEIW